MASLLLGVKPTPISGAVNRSNTVPSARAVNIRISWNKSGTNAVNHDLAELLLLRREPPPNATLPPRPRRFPAGPWLYNGSQITPAGFQAQVEGSFISLIRDEAALVNNPNDDRDDDRIHYPDESLLPPVGTPVEITLTFATQP
jgi:hypothetical protein